MNRLLRAVYRTIELSDGWNGRIISTEVLFSTFPNIATVCESTENDFLRCPRRSYDYFSYVYDELCSSGIVAWPCQRVAEVSVEKKQRFKSTGSKVLNIRVEAIRDIDFTYSTEEFLLLVSRTSYKGVVERSIIMRITDLHYRVLHPGVIFSLHKFIFPYVFFENLYNFYSRNDRSLRQNPLTNWQLFKFESRTHATIKIFP